MTPAEFIAARERLGESAEQMAISLDLAPQIVTAFENGSLAIPADTARELIWRVATVDRLEALVSSGLPECTWLNEWHAQPVPSRAAERLKRLEALQAHVATCATCQAREKYIAERFGPMPERPVAGWQGVLVGIGKQIQRLPAWLRPGVIGALLFLAYSALKLLLLLPRLQSTPHPLVRVAAGFAISAAMGFAIGSLWALLKWAQRTYGRKPVAP
jgi:DNA-binding XRE family transcriptional regulator